MLNFSDWGFASWFWFKYGHWSLIHPFAEFRLSITILRVQREFMSFKSSCGALEDAGGTWPGFLLYVWFLFDLVLFCLNRFKLPWFWLYMWILFYLVRFGLIQMINMNSHSKVHAFWYPTYNSRPKTGCTMVFALFLVLVWLSLFLDWFKYHIWGYN